jgi:hypothetical protein
MARAAAAGVCDELPRRSRGAATIWLVYRGRYTLGLVSGRYDIELEPEVRDWLDQLRLKDYAKVEAMADILAERAETLGEPYSRHLRGKTRELRFHLDRSAVRISYWLAPGMRAVLLTVFRKTRQIERAEVDRAVAAQQVCESGHEAHSPATEIYDRKWL